MEPETESAYPPLREWDIWMEGYSATGEHGTAHKVATVTARTFRSACKKWAAKTDQPSLFNERSLSYWSCGLYDNEADARKTFG